MNDLRRDGRELLEASRRERTPGAELKQRLLAELLAAAARATPAADEPPPLASRLSSSSKALILAALVLAIALAIFLAGRP